jgi:hypothetical protein
MTAIYDLNRIHQQLRATHPERVPKPASLYDLNGVHDFMRAQKQLRQVPLKQARGKAPR